MICYKVVNSETNFFTSYMANFQYKLSYSLNTVTAANIGKIMVFDSLEKARNFVSHKYIILECECGELTKINEMLHFTCMYNDHRTLKRFWLDSDTIDSKYKFPAPDGTYGTDWVKPIQVVN